MEAKRHALDAEIAALKAELAASEQETEYLIAQSELEKTIELSSHARMSSSRDGRDVRKAGKEVKKRS
jgi:hypothetical protein